MGDHCVLVGIADECAWMIAGTAIDEIGDAVF